MEYSFNAAGLGEAILRELRIGATVIKGQVVIYDITNQLGNITDASTTAAADSVGVTYEAGTYAASTPVDVLTNIQPFSVYKCRGTLGATNNTALTIHTQTSASATVFSAATVPNVDFSMGTLFMISGANKGRKAIVDSFTNATSYTCTNGFPSSIAVGDKCVVVPWALGCKNVQLSTTLDQGDASIVVATGIDANVVDCVCDYNESNPLVDVYFALGDHFLNPRS